MVVIVSNCGMSTTITEGLNLSPYKHNYHANQRAVITNEDWERWQRITGGNATPRHLGAGALGSNAVVRLDDGVELDIWNRLAERYNLIAGQRLPGMTELSDGSLLDYDIDRIATGPEQRPTIPSVDFDHIQEVMARNGGRAYHA